MQTRSRPTGPGCAQASATCGGRSSIVAPGDNTTKKLGIRFSKCAYPGCCDSCSARSSSVLPVPGFRLMTRTDEFDSGCAPSAVTNQAWRPQRPGWIRTRSSLFPVNGATRRYAVPALDRMLSQIHELLGIAMRARPSASSCCSTGVPTPSCSVCGESKLGGHNGLSLVLTHRTTPFGGSVVSVSTQSCRVPVATLRPGVGSCPLLRVASGCPPRAGTSSDAERVWVVCRGPWGSSNHHSASTAVITIVPPTADFFVTL
jgi:hypothetical protein